TPLMKQKGVRWCYFCHVPGDICLPTRYYSSERRYKVCSDDVSDLCRNLIFDWQDFLLSSAGPTVQSYLLELGVGQVALEHLRCNNYLETWRLCLWGWGFMEWFLASCMSF